MKIEDVNTISYLLINECVEINADTMKRTLENVTNKGEALGTWQITVEKLPNQ